MRNIYILAIVCVAMLASCKKETPPQVHKVITTINDTLYSKARTWTEAFITAASTKDFSKLEPIREEMEKFINKSIDDVEDLSDVGDAKDLKAQEIAYLKFEKDMISKRFAPFEKFDEQTKDDEIGRTYQNLVSASQEEQEEYMKLQKLLEAYAQRNNIPVSPATPAPAE